MEGGEHHHPRGTVTPPPAIRPPRAHMATHPKVAMTHTPLPATLLPVVTRPPRATASTRPLRARVTLPRTPVTRPLRARDTRPRTVTLPLRARDIRPPRTAVTHPPRARDILPHTLAKEQCRVLAKYHSRIATQAFRQGMRKKARRIKTKARRRARTRTRGRRRTKGRRRERIKKRARTERGRKERKERKGRRRCLPDQRRRKHPRQSPSFSHQAAAWSPATPTARATRMSWPSSKTRHSKAQSRAPPWSRSGTKRCGQVLPSVRRTRSPLRCLTRICLEKMTSWGRAKSRSSNSKKFQCPRGCRPSQPSLRADLAGLIKCQALSLSS
mmetsp:Transcript_17027/g.43474  ORF Transcript_17027/g.43474 Transcript_17027/m.43474 type:complete len:328 (-) Transcript_17027:122-1105(-)